MCAATLSQSLVPDGLVTEATLSQSLVPDGLVTEATLSQSLVPDGLVTEATESESRPLASRQASWVEWPVTLGSYQCC
jgi:hypothetical protein